MSDNTCASCKSLTIELERHKLLLAEQSEEDADLLQKNAHELILLRALIGQYQRQLNNQQAIIEMLRRSSIPVGVIAIASESLSLLTESQGHQVRFEQLDWVARRDSLLARFREANSGVPQ